MGFLSSAFGGKTKSSQNSFRAPAARLMPHFGYLSDLAQGAIETPLKMFPEQTYAPMTADEQAALEQLRAAAGALPGTYEGFLSPATEAYGAALAGPESVMGMGLQDVASNPYLAAMSESIQSRVNRNLQENILPSLSLAGAGGGGLGGTRQGVAEGIAGRGTSEALADSLASLYGQAWQAGLGAETSRYNQAMAGRQGALGLLPTMTGQATYGATMPADILQRAGGIQRTEDQRALDEEMARFQFEQMEPWQRSEMGYNLLMPYGQAFSRGGSQGTVTETPSVMSAIGRVATLGGVLAPSFGGGGGAGFGAAGGYGLGAPGYGYGYGINPAGQQAQMLAEQWGSPWMWS